MVRTDYSFNISKLLRYQFSMKHRQNLNFRRLTQATGILTLLLSSGSVSAQLAIISYEMERSTVTPSRPGSIVNTNVSADNLVAGEGINVKDEGAEQWAWRDWGTGISSADAALASNKYWQWGFDITGNVDIDLSTLDISIDKTSNGPDDFEIRSSVNGGSTQTLFTHDFAGSFGSAVVFDSIELTGISSLQDLVLGDSIVFTLIGFNGNAFNGGNLGIVNHGSFAGGDGLVINGNIAAVPEPHQYALIVGLSLVTIAGIQRFAKIETGRTPTKI